MRTATCQCGHQESGATDKDALNKIQSHMHNAHGGRGAEMKKMIKQAQKSIHEGVIG